MDNDYGKTLNLPDSEFPMRANLPKREPDMLKKWQDENFYEKLMEKNEGKPLFILHDGPPYANGDLHTGHMLNKSLKDIVTRFKNMDGFKAPYIHGWDTHGLPIEQQAIKKLGINRHEVGPVKFREACREFALTYVANQKEQVKRLGALGDYEDSYMTLTPDFEAKQIQVFGEMALKGYIYRGLKPVYWCCDCETALAEAEIEYAEDKTDSIYVKFAVKDGLGKFDGISEKVYFVIWTTTTWTLPGNVAISVNPGFEYSVVKAGNEAYVLASELVEITMQAAHLSEYEIVRKLSGADLEYIVCEHPFLERDSLVIVGDHVTLEAGTGCVHTAPGHGTEDYFVCRNYPQLPIVVPVDSKGVLNELAGPFAGMYYAKSNAKIIEHLKETGALFAIEPIIHQYPHCWRCNDPIVFRATEQWFASIDDFKQDALRAIKEVKWYPAWGEERISKMVEDRGDWCISRQRIWGVPIPIFYCADCGKELITRESIDAVSKLFGEKGSDSWYELDAKEILPAGTKCACGCDNFTKEKDIMDVWFDSGSSHAGVLEVKKGLRFPADLYLEGNDQYRGWFQSSLLTSVATKGTAPYRAVLTHGFVVDGEGKKMSKSKGNGVDPQEVIREYGADIMRLWTVSADFKSEIRFSKEILKQLSEVYRKIRNTAKYILGNISDFNPDTDLVPFAQMNEIDRWALIRLDILAEKALAAYRSYDFHLIYHNVHNFCVVDMSNFYLDVIKDRLYAEKAQGSLRRSSQSAMYLILDTLVRLIAPILCYTADEIWQFMPHRKDDDTENVVFNAMPQNCGQYRDDALLEKWDRILSIREDVAKALESARMQKIIGHSLNARAVLYAGGNDMEFLNTIADELATLFIVSQVELLPVAEAADNCMQGEKNPGIRISVAPATGEKCERCWIFDETVGSHPDAPALCDRCHHVINEG